MGGVGLEVLPQTNIWKDMENDSEDQAVSERGAELSTSGEELSRSSVSAVAIACVSVSARPASHTAANSGALRWLRVASKT